MKMFRFALAGILPGVVLFLGLQPLVRAAWTIAPRLGVQSCFSSDDTAKVAAPSESRQLCFADRVAYQRAIEEVYWRHRIWPRGGGERPDRKPSLDAVMSQAMIEQKVQDYLRKSELLEEEWQKPITPEQLQAEMDRMAQHSKQPEVLRELFAALGNDPFLIAECLAKPVLSERLQFATAEQRKEPLESWSAKAQTQMSNVITAATANYTLPVISDQPSECIDSWAATATTNAPARRESHTAVWTGSEMIVWGGAFDLNTGGRYNPSTDSWTAVTTINAPTGRYGHTAVWTGSDMIVWAGYNFPAGYLNTGGRYNPGTDSWTATSTTGAPTSRINHTAVWTGNEMIVWGGSDEIGVLLNTGGRYNPSMDSWKATTTTNAPSGRGSHTAIWTDSEMIIWGGGSSRGDSNTGGRFNPSTDSWTATSTTNTPTARQLHTAVWTDSEMIVWGGLFFDGTFHYLNTGGRYNPNTDSWTATSTTNAPAGRESHTAVWTGSEMIGWGGIDVNANALNTGGRYNPDTDSWTSTTTTNAPTGRYRHRAVWTDSEMIVWGGVDHNSVNLNTGGRYCAQAGLPITLEARIHRQEGKRGVDLTWSPADGGSVNILRNGVVIGITDDDGAAKDRLGNQTGIFTYHICETDSGDCSNEVSVRVFGTDD